ncbi:MAG: outer membrane beta-barrel protein [Acidobacteria bacterium]|nr:outer membrane beta-barrel protein [Acidobacteriota bacterium]
MKRHIQAGLLTTMLGTAHWFHAQAVPTAIRAGGIAQIGAGWSIASPDYGPSKIQGVSIYGTFDFTRHWGVEGDVHRISLKTPSTIGEDSYLVGPRYVFHHGRIHPYAKALAGFGRFHYLYNSAPSATYTYKIYSFGGGVDVRARSHLNIRAVDLEYQKWPGFPTNGITPLALTFGAAYAF